MAAVSPSNHSQRASWPWAWPIRRVLPEKQHWVPMNLQTAKMCISKLRKLMGTKTGKRPVSPNAEVADSKVRRVTSPTKLLAAVGLTNAVCQDGRQLTVVLEEEAIESVHSPLTGPMRAQ